MTNSYEEIYTLKKGDASQSASGFNILKNQLM
jgi:hypothetical protein